MTRKKDTLTEDQQAAYDDVRRRLKDGETRMKVSGYAGTGKTHLLTRLVRDYMRDPFVVTPTHKSAQVISRVLKSSGPTTIHAFLGLQLTGDGQGGHQLRRGAARVPNKGIVFVDEASMIGTDLWANIEQQEGLQWVFFGDPAQLPPVNEPPSAVFDLPGAMLTQIVRQAQGNPIIRLATAVREGRPYLSEAGYDEELGAVITRREKAFMDSAVRAFEAQDVKMAPDVRILAYRNVTVHSYNQRIREALSLKGRFAKDDWLMLQETYYVDSWPVARNSEEVRVLSVKERDLSTDYGHWRIHEIKARHGGKLITMPVLHEVEQDRFVLLQAKHKQAALEGKGTWEPYYGLKATFAWVDYAYALTIHKSQGSTFDTVYVDHRDACRSSDRQRLVYVAVTRPARRLALLV